MKFLKKLTACFRCSEEEDFNLKNSLSALEYYQPEEYDIQLGVAEMAEQSARSLEILKIQTACCRAEIEALRAEIHELRIEAANRSTLNNSTDSDDTGFSGSNGIDSPTRLNAFDLVPHSITTVNLDYTVPQVISDVASRSTTTSSSTRSVRHGTQSTAPYDGYIMPPRQMSAARMTLRRAEANINERLIEAIEEVSRKIPAFIDFPTEV